MRIMKILKTIPNLASNSVGAAKFNWRTYKKTHLLAQQYYRIRKNNKEHLLDLARVYVTPGTTVSVDSFSPALSQVLSIDKSFEHSYVWNFWHRAFKKYPVEYVDTILDLPTQIVYNNVINLGSHMFKYKDLENIIKNILHLCKLAHSGGTVICCLPMLLIQYHRLKYSKQQFVEQIIECLTPHGVGCNMIRFESSNQCCYLFLKKQ